MNKINLIAHGFFPFFLLALAGWLAHPSASFAQVIESTFRYPGYLEPDIFVITNRQTDLSGGQFEFINQVKADPSLTFFRVNASRPDSLLLTSLDSSAFLAEISDIKNQDWLLFIHGDSKTFEQAVIRGLTIQNMHQVRVIVFAWPSRDLKIHGLENFYTSCQNVEKSLDHFKSVLRMMEGLRNSPDHFLEENHLSLFLHSLGNYFLDRMGNNKVLVETSPLLFDNVIINAAAVEQKNHPEWVEQLRFQKNIFINSNRQDFNLRGLKTFTSHGKQLGQKVTRHFASNAVYLNFTQSVGFRFPTGTTHTYFIGKVPEKKQNIGRLFYELFHGLNPDLTDATRFKQRKNSLNKLVVR